MAALLVVVLISLAITIRDRTSAASTGSAEIVLEDMRFTPNQLNAKVGVPLTVRLTNRGTERHDLNFPVAPHAWSRWGRVDPGARRDTDDHASVR